MGFSGVPNRHVLLAANKNTFIAFITKGIMGNYFF